ncbi:MULTISPECIES: hypothetical protein [unclassified Sulfitobacter]|uniref:hypothetical protein n=3 Tax=Sulfitobacter TaxID=60136 RepID=UPI0032974DEF|tara:strand:- start:1444 stop:2856 length:1413 start_codon:yes stop_codon:yes gene_type:complete
MIPRQRLLQAPHMTALRDHPALDAMTEGELCALDAFMGFCTEHGVGDPGEADIRAFARLRAQAPKALQDLRGALRHLGLGKDFLIEIAAVQAAVDHQANFKGIPKGRTRNYTRTVSVPVEDLPMDWRQTLRRLEVEGEYAPDILGRMRARLGMFVWSARRAGHPANLANTDALRALYADMRARSITRQQEQAKKKGLNDDIDEPRWAYLRSTWEELRRFARAHGLPEDVWDKLTITYSMLTKREGKQAAQKLAKAKAAGTRPELLKRAEAMLAEAETLKLPQMRHALRNRAAAIALGCAVPARPGDVQAHHVLGAGITFEPGRNGYRFHYKATKTAGSTGVDIDIPLLPWWNKFIDAVILQDDDPRYLGQLRGKAASEKRPLYVQYDGTSAVYAWYSRMWKIIAGTGGHIARTLIRDEPGAAGVQLANKLNGHKPGSPTARKYESEDLQRATVLEGQNMMASLFDDEDEV